MCRKPNQFLFRLPNPTFGFRTFTVCPKSEQSKLDHFTWNFFGSLSPKGPNFLFRFRCKKIPQKCPKSEPTDVLILRFPKFGRLSFGHSLYVHLCTMLSYLSVPSNATNIVQRLTFSAWNEKIVLLYDSPLYIQWMTENWTPKNKTTPNSEHNSLVFGRIFEPMYICKPNAIAIMFGLLFIDQFGLGLFAFCLRTYVRILNN